MVKANYLHDTSLLSMKSQSFLGCVSFSTFSCHVKLITISYSANRSLFHVMLKL